MFFYYYILYKKL